MYEKIEHFYSRAIKAIQPESEFKGKNDGSIVWLNGTAPIDENLIHEKAIELKTEYNNNNYQRDRAESYASIPDQLDYIYHNGVDAWKENMILPVKNKYPKEVA